MIDSQRSQNSSFGAPPGSILVENSSKGNYSDQFSTAPSMAVNTIWNERCRKLGNLLKRRPTAEDMLVRQVVIRLSSITNRRSLKIIPIQLINRARLVQLVRTCKGKQ
jgi:hypothetical protein